MYRQLFLLVLNLLRMELLQPGKTNLQKHKLIHSTIATDFMSARSRWWKLLINTISQFEEELQIGFSFQISKWSTNYEIPLQPLLPGRSSSCRSPIWQQRFYLTKSNTWDVNLLKHFPEVLFSLRVSQLLLNAIKTDFINDKDLWMNESINKKTTTLSKTLSDGVSHLECQQIIIVMFVDDLGEVCTTIR